MFPAFISVVQYYLMSVSNVTINTLSSINYTPFCRCLPLWLTFPAAPQLILLHKFLYASPYVFQSVSQSVCVCLSFCLIAVCLSTLFFIPMFSSTTLYFVFPLYEINHEEIFQSYCALLKCFIILSTIDQI